MCKGKQRVRYHGAAADYLRRPDPVKRLVREAGKMKQEMESIRNRRKDLFGLLGEDPGYSDSDAFSSYAERILALALPESDRKVMERYICYGELLHLLDKAVTSRIGGRNGEIMLDFLYGKLKEDELAQKYGISLRTIRRVKQMGRQAIGDEIKLRMAVLPELSW